MTLTFDNGPSADVSPRVLDELASREVSAWFCVVGSQLREAGGVSLVARILDEGHLVANHSLTHQTALGDLPTVAHARSEISDMDALLRETAPDWGEPWFRPFGRGGQLGPHLLSDAACDELARYSYSVLLWNCVPRDWEDPIGWVDTACREIEDLDHAVVVLHDVRSDAMEQLPRFLDALANDGVIVTTDLPDSCVPIRAGQAVSDLSGLVTPS